MRIKVEKVGKITVLRLSGKLAVGDGDRALRETFVQLLDQGRKHVVSCLD